MTRIGLAIVGDDVAIAVSRRGVVRLASDRLSDDVCTSIERILRSLPRDRWRTATLVVGLGAPHVQIRVIEGLPPTGNARFVADLMRENATTFFLARPDGLDVAPVYKEGGVTRGAAFDRNLTSVLIDIGRSLRLPVFAIVPLASSSAAHEAAAGLLEVGRNPSLALRPRLENARLVRRRLIAGLASLLFAFAAAMAAMAPTIHALLDRERMRAAEAHDREALSELDALRAETTRINALLSAYSSFATQHAEELGILSAVAHDSPDSTAIVSFRVDSIAGSIVVLTPDAAGLIAALDRISGIAAVRVSGPITKERVGTATLDRLSIRFRRAAPTKATRRA